MPPRQVDDEPIIEVPDEAPTQEMPVTRQDAEDGFDQLLTRLEEAEPEDLARRERDEIYRDVNSAFRTLSARLGDDEVELLEDSYQRMQAQMSRLKIKPPSFAVEPNAKEL